MDEISTLFETIDQIYFLFLNKEGGKVCPSIWKGGSPPPKGASILTKGGYKMRLIF